MAVWIINLKDNRTDKPTELCQSKFDFCKEKGIVGIGWVGYDSNESPENLPGYDAYQTAKNDILQINTGDYVWTKNAETNEYYLCKILSPATYKGDEYGKYDIGYCCECEYIYIGSEMNLPEGISAEKLVCLTAIRRVSDDITLRTNDFIKNYDFELIKQKNENSKKKINKIIGLASIVMIVGIVIGVIIATNKEHIHTFDYNNPEVILEPTCEKEGIERIYCQKCSYYEEIKTGYGTHDFEEHVILEPTCTVSGIKELVCKVCGTTEQKEIPAAHKFENKYCTVCGAKKKGVINTSSYYGELAYGISGSEPRTKCRITNVFAENNLGIMTVYFDGRKTYDSSGENSTTSCYWLLIIKDKYGKILYSDQVGTHAVVNQSFKVKTTINYIFDDSEDYEIILKDYLI